MCHFVLLGQVVDGVGQMTGYLAPDGLNETGDPMGPWTAQLGPVGGPTAFFHSFAAPPHQGPGHFEVLVMSLVDLPALMSSMMAVHKVSQLMVLGFVVTMH